MILPWLVVFQWIKVHMAFLIWEGMYRSGFQIGTTVSITKIHQTQILKDPHLDGIEYYGVLYLTIIFGRIIVYGERIQDTVTPIKA